MKESPTLSSITHIDNSVSNYTSSLQEDSNVKSTLYSGVDSNLYSTTNDRDNLPTDCDDGGSDDDDSFGSPLRLGRLVIDLDAGCETSNRETIYMSAPSVDSSGNKSTAAELAVSSDTMNKIEHQATVSKDCLTVKIKRKTIVTKSDVLQPSEVNGSSNAPTIDKSFCGKGFVATSKPLSSENSLTLSSSSSDEKAKKNKQNISKSNNKSKSGIKLSDLPNPANGKCSDGEISGNGAGPFCGNASHQTPQGSRSASPAMGRDTTSRTGFSMKNISHLESGEHIHNSNLVDPYEFNAKVEDKMTLEPVMKKLKIEKMDYPPYDGKPSLYDNQQMMRDVSVDTCNIAVATDPDCLGPCEPGSHVVLEGIVWQETSNGLLVVNVTWRGKTYVGTLMDATQHDWAPPIRLSGEFGIGDIETKTPKGRAKRGRGQTATPKNDTNERRLRNRRIAVAAGSKESSNGTSSETSSLVATSTASDSKRKRPAQDQSNGHNEETGPAAKQSKTTGSSRGFFATDIECAALPPPQFVCSEPGCCKRYQREAALRYHQSSAHPPLPNNVALKTSANSETRNTDAVITEVVSSAAQSTTLQQQPDSDKKPNIQQNNKTQAKSSKTKSSVSSNSDKEGTGKDILTSVEGNATVVDQPSCNVDTLLSKASDNTISDSQKGASKDSDSTNVVASLTVKLSSDVLKSSDVSKLSDTQPSKISIISQSKGHVSIGNSVPTTNCASTINTIVASGLISNVVSAVPTSVVSSVKLSPPLLPALTVTNTLPQVSPSVTSVPTFGPTSGKDTINSENKNKTSKLEKLDKPKAKVAAIKTAPVLSNPASTSVRTTLVSVTTVSQVPPLALANLKPIQPKPTIMGEPSSVNPALTDLKEMKVKKSKKKKKDKDRNRDVGDKDKSREAGDPDKERVSEKSIEEKVKPTTISLLQPPLCGEFTKPSLTNSPPQVKVISEPESSLLTSSLVAEAPPSLVAPAERQSPVYLSTNSLQEQNNKVQSPAYSDISDANDSAPSLEQEGPVDSVGVSSVGVDFLSNASPSVEDSGNRLVIRSAKDAVDLTQKNCYSQPPSLLPVMPTNLSSPMDSDHRKAKAKSSSSSHRETSSNKNDTSQKPVPPLSSFAGSDIKRDMLMGQSHSHLHSSISEVKKEPAKTRTPPSLTHINSKSTSGQPFPANKHDKVLNLNNPSQGVVTPPGSGRPIGCAYPMHSTPNASFGIKQEKSLVDNDSRSMQQNLVHSRPPMLIPDRERFDGDQKTRERCNENRQILSESLELRNQVQAPPHQPLLIKMPSHESRSTAQEGEIKSKHSIDMDERQKVPKNMGQEMKERMKGDEAGKGMSKEMMDSGRTSTDDDQRDSTPSKMKDNSSLKSPQCTTPKPRDIPTNNNSAVLHGSIPYQFYPYPAMGAVGSIEGGVMYQPMDPAGMYAMFAPQMAAFRYMIPMVDNASKDKPSMQMSPNSLSLETGGPSVNMRMPSFDADNSNGNSSHKLKELKEIAKRNEGNAGGRSPASSSSSTDIGNKKAMLSPREGGGGTTPVGRVSPPTQRYVHEHVHHVVPSAPAGFLYSQFGPALMPHPMTASVRMARPSFTK